MTELERIQFAQAALACKRKGPLSHTAPTSVTGEKSKCVPGRIRHHFKDGIACQYCGAPKGDIRAKSSGLATTTEPTISLSPRERAGVRGKEPSDNHEPNQSPKPIQVPRDLS